MAARAPAQFDKRKRPTPPHTPPPREDMATRKVRLINQLTHTKGAHAGEPFRLRDWQEHGIIRRLFATDDVGRRIYRTCLLMMPRKNGKTELAAALAIDGLLFDREAGAEVYSAAADREQASLVFNVAAQMIRNDVELSASCDVLDSQKRIVHRKSGSVYRALSAEAYSKHGFNASRVIYDELHAAPSRELWDVLTTSTGARTQPLVVAISTAGYDRHSILWELYSHAKRVAETPEIDPTFLPILYEAAIDADWSDETVWHAANPALGDFRSLDEMRVAYQRAKEIPAQENTFRRLYLNQWTEQAARWIPIDAWDACAVPRDGDPLVAFRGRRAYLGVDLASTSDLTALVAVLPSDGGFDVVAAFFVPAERIRERSTRDRVPYDEWARRGVLTATPGNSIDYAYVAATIRAWARAFAVREIAFDPWNARQLVTELQESDKLPVVEVPQTFGALSAATKTLESAVLTKRLRHDGHPVLRWNVQNVAVETDVNGNLRASKQASSEKIDGVAALIMAIDRCDRDVTPKPPSYRIVVLRP